MICVGRSSVPFSMPFATLTTEAPDGTAERMVPHASRMNCTGIAETTKSASRRASPGSPDTRSESGIVYPSSRGLTRAWVSASHSSAS
jgi:hypothetical protein